MAIVELAKMLVSSGQELVSLLDELRQWRAIGAILQRRKDLADAIAAEQERTQREMTGDASDVVEQRMRDELRRSVTADTSSVVDIPSDRPPTMLCVPCGREVTEPCARYRCPIATQASPLVGDSCGACGFVRCRCEMAAGEATV